MNLESLNAFTDLVILDISKTKIEEEEITDEFAFLEQIYEKEEHEHLYRQEWKEEEWKDWCKKQKEIEILINESMDIQTLLDLLNLL